jgi:phosphohistidine phosphatase
MPRKDDPWTLHLLRHAKSSWDDLSLDDHDRPLAARGRKAAALIAQYVEHHRIKVDLVLCSSALRARQTFDLVGPSLAGSPDIRMDERLYTAGAADLLSRLRGIDEHVRGLLMIGHNPALQQLAESLAGDGAVDALEELYRKFPTGALATVSGRLPWNAWAAGSGYLDSLVVPRHLKAS